MSAISELSLNTSGSLLILIVGFLAAIGLSYFVYRRTIPPVSTGWRILLMSLRAVAVMLVILILFEPILSLTRKKEEKPVVAVLVDNSASMSIKDQKVDRQSQLRNVLDSELFNQPSDDHELRFFPYSYALHDALSAPTDSLSLSGDGTDLTRALQETKEQLSEDYFAATVVITDGADNLGANPARLAETYGVPIYPIAIGDPSQQNDVLITDYVTNEIAYAGNEIPVDVTIRSSGFDGSRVTVSLTREGRALDSQYLTLSEDGLEQKARLTFTPEAEGLHKYDIAVSHQEGELTERNNSKSFYVKVLKSKLKVLVVAGGPGADFSFLKRALIGDEDIDVTTAVEKLNGEFYRGASLPSPNRLEEMDCIVLVDYPRRTSKPQTLQRLKGVLAKGKPLLFISGKATDVRKLDALIEFLPFERPPATSAERSVYVGIPRQSEHHPITRLAEDDLDNRERWRELPPVFTNLVSVQLDESAQTLATVDLQRSNQSRSLPLMAALSRGKRKSIAVMTYGIWRWDLLMWGTGKTNENYLRLIKNALRWLTTEDDSKLVKVTTNKEIYRSGEEVKFTAQVYYENYEPADGAEVTAQVRSADETQSLTLENIGEGRYEGSFQVLEGGDYEFTGTAHEQGRVLGKDTGSFTVEEFSLEYQNTRMNEALLRKIAAESGGRFFTAANFDTLSQLLSFPEKYITHKNEWEIWNKVPMLIACIVLLGSEWLIRKRKGML